MENCNSIEKNETRSLANIMANNSSLIMECLDISALISTQLTTDCKINNTSRDINCMMAEAEYQNENLVMLLDALKFIKVNIFN